MLASGGGGQTKNLADASTVCHELALSLHRERRAEKHQHLADLVQHPLLLLISTFHYLVSKTGHHVSVCSVTALIPSRFCTNWASKEFKKRLCESIYGSLASMEQLSFGCNVEYDVEKILVKRHPLSPQSQNAAEKHSIWTPTIVRQSLEIGHS